MPPDYLLTAVRLQPFQPFRLQLTDGRAFDIRHPDQMIVGRRSAVIGLPADANDPYLDRRITVDLIHVVSQEPLQISSSSNGPA
jgi:hypothetical protein